jgi:hypothetical protein
VSTRKIRILVYSSAPFFHVIRHIFEGRDEFEIVGESGSARRLAETSQEIDPQLIVADWKAVRTGIRSAVLAIKHCSPSSKLILICPLTDFKTAGRRCGADACLAPEEIFTRLPRTAIALSRGLTSEKQIRKGVTA